MNQTKLHQPGKKVFVCFDRDSDEQYARLLEHYSMGEYEFGTGNEPIRQAKKTRETDIEQANIVEAMKQFEYILVIVGKRSYLSKWMKWEIDCAKRKDIRLKFAAVKVDKTYIHPEGLPIPATSFAYAFETDAINNALNQARNHY